VDQAQKVVPFKELKLKQNLLPVMRKMSFLFNSGHSVSWGRCGEKETRSKLEGLVFIPQEWQKKQAILLLRKSFKFKKHYV
jgi:hypothetical protein